MVVILQLQKYWRIEPTTAFFHSLTVPTDPSFGVLGLGPGDLPNLNSISRVFLDIDNLVNYDMTP